MKPGKYWFGLRFLSFSAESNDVFVGLRFNQANV